VSLAKRLDDAVLLVENWVLVGLLHFELFGCLLINYTSL
jgi:hypothetical protein